MEPDGVDGDGDGDDNDDDDEQLFKHTHKHINEPSRPKTPPRPSPPIRNLCPTAIEQYERKVGGFFSTPDTLCPYQVGIFASNMGTVQDWQHKRYPGGGRVPVFLPRFDCPDWLGWTGETFRCDMTINMRMRMGGMHDSHVTGVWRRAM